MCGSGLGSAEDSVLREVKVCPQNWVNGTPHSCSQSHSLTNTHRLHHHSQQWDPDHSQEIGGGKVERKFIRTFRLHFNGHSISRWRKYMKIPGEKMCMKMVCNVISSLYRLIFIYIYSNEQLNHGRILSWDLCMWQKMFKSPIDINAWFMWKSE